MNRVKYLAKTMSLVQRETYTRIKEDGVFIAKGSRISTCNVLMQLGLIIPNPASNNQNEFVLKGKALNIPFSKKMPLPREVIKEITTSQPDSASPKHKPVIWGQPSKAPTVYSNVSREQHVAKWLSEQVKVPSKMFASVKCLTHSEMEYIMSNQSKTAQDLADHLGKEKHEVLLFCQANAIELPQAKKKGWHKKKESEQYI